jgi:SAM-dependent methyltransferase
MNYIASTRLAREDFDKWLRELSNCQVNLLSRYRHSYISSYNAILSCSQWRYQIYHNLAQIVRMMPRGRILDFGCGLGTQAYILSRLGYSLIPLETVIDSSIEGFLKDQVRAEQQKRDREVSMVLMNNMLRDKIGTPLVWYDGLELPFGGGAFDAVLAYAVLEHVPGKNLQALIAALHRVIRKGGYLFIFELPQRYSYAERIARLLGMSSHENLFTRQEVLDLVLPRGFESVYFKRSGLVCQRPLNLSNLLFPILLPLERVLSETPLAHMYHHMEFAFQKVT